MAKRRQQNSTEKFRETARETDSTPELVATAKFLRRLLPGDTDAEPSTKGGKLSSGFARLVSGMREDEPSVMRELGLGVAQAWQALSEAQRRRQGTAEVAILFTDLVGFSSWALEAGDEAALELLKQVTDAEEDAVSANGGVVVKQLGDGSMSVFSQAKQAVGAALDAQRELAEIEVEGHAPEQRAGIHLGQPRKVEGDFLGVDVNIAARVGDAAAAQEVLVSDVAHATLEGAGFKFGRKRLLSAAGAPEDLAVYPVKA
jgi:adenylate cyclase